MRRCSKPRCFEPASVLLAYNYTQRLAILEDPTTGFTPHLYGLCVACADSLVPPRGWALEDRRRVPRLFLTPEPGRLMSG